MQPFHDLDVTPVLITYGVEYYLANHPTNADNFNAAMKMVVAQLKALFVAESGGEQVKTINAVNFVHQGAGVFQIDVDTLQSEVALGTLLLRDNSGVFEYSDDAGSTWNEVGSGAGGVTDHTLLTNIGSNTHAQIDSHISNSGLHSDTTDHTALSNIGTNTHAQIDSHISNSGLHSDTTDHTLLSNIGSNTHAQLDSHLADSGIHASTFALRGNGTGRLAIGTFSSPYTLNADALTLFGVVTLNALGSAESFFKLIDTEYSNVILDFGKNSSNQLYVTQGIASTGATETKTSTVVISSDMTQIPVEVGVMIDRTANTVTFFLGGACEPSQNTTLDHTHNLAMNQEIRLGDALNGDLSWFGICSTLLYRPDSEHTPLQKGLQYARNWLIRYAMSEGSGATLGDSIGAIKGNPYDLTVNGTWQAV